MKRVLDKHYDIVIIGGGINGAASAAALSAAGYKTLLVEKNDFASGCSSHSSNLIWGGIKYLENRDYRLVYKLCKSRNILMKHFPSAIKEIRFITSVPKHFRIHPLFVFLGTLLYWLMGRCHTQAPKPLSKYSLIKKNKLISSEDLAGGAEYSDAYLVENDARFVFSFIKRAVHQGATATNYSEVTGLDHHAQHWTISIRDRIAEQTQEVRAKVIINAAGPWTDLINQKAKVQTKYKHHYAKGVHLILEIPTEKNHALAFIANDGRLFFAIPMADKLCVGTTDTPSKNIESLPSKDDIDFILENANAHLNLRKKLGYNDIISHRCSVRPLAVKTQTFGRTECHEHSLSRKHHIECDRSKRIISIHGGKITDCINVGEEVLNWVKRLPITRKKTSPLWFGEACKSEKHRFQRKLKKHWNVSEEIFESLWRRWDLDSFKLLPLIKQVPMRDILIPEISLIRAEVYLSRDLESVYYLDDYLRRRTMISQVVKHDVLIQRKELREISEILFREDSETQLENYIRLYQSCLNLRNITRHI